MEFLLTNWSKRKRIFAEETENFKNMNVEVLKLHDSYFLKLMNHDINNVG